MSSVMVPHLECCMTPSPFTPIYTPRKLAHQITLWLLQHRTVGFRKGLCLLSCLLLRGRRIRLLLFRIILVRILLFLFLLFFLLFIRYFWIPCSIDLMSTRTLNSQTTTVYYRHQHCPACTGTQEGLPKRR